jgi:hypothetical protein
MKTLLMLNPNICGSGDTKRYHIYPVLDDRLIYYEEAKTDDDEDISINVPYNEENLLKYPDGNRWVRIKDESSEDDFEVCSESDAIVCENDYELAIALLRTIDGLATGIVNLYKVTHTND